LNWLHKTAKQRKENCKNQKYKQEKYEKVQLMQPGLNQTITWSLSWSLKVTGIDIKRSATYGFVLVIHINQVD